MNKGSDEVLRLSQDLLKHDLEKRLLRFLKRRLPRNVYLELREELLNGETRESRRIDRRPPTGGWAWE